MKVIDK
jgi:hypothetical protein